MSRRIRVLHVVGNLELGGGQKLTALVASSLDRTRFDVSVLNFGPPGPYNDYLARHGVEVIDMGLRRPIVRRNPPWKLAEALLTLVRVLWRSPRWDIVHTHMFLTSVVCTIPARLRGSRVMGTAHRIYYPRMQGHIERLLAKLQETIVVDSWAVRDILREKTRIPAEKYTVIHNGIDTEEFAGAPTQAVARRLLGLPADALIVGEVAHLVPHKGQRHLVAAVAMLRERLPHVHLLLVGDGPDRALLDAEIHRLELRDHVTTLGARGDLPTVLVALDVLALPSTFEGFGIVQAEAMYVGRPVVATDHGGSTEVVVDGKTGFLVPFGDVSALAGALGCLAESPELRATMGRSGSQRARALFTAEAMALRYGALYELAGTGGGGTR